MHARLWRLALFALVVTFAASAASAQRGWSFAPYAFGTGLAVDDLSDAESEEGGGLGLRVGYGVSKTVTLYLNTSGARIDSDGALEDVVRDLPTLDIGPIDDRYAVVSGELGVQFNLLPSGMVNPILRTGLRGTSVVLDARGSDADDDPRLGGGGLTLGAGVDVRLSRKLAVEVVVEGTGGWFEELETDDVAYRNFEDIEFASGRASVGLVWRPWNRHPRRRGRYRH